VDLDDDDAGLFGDLGLVHAGISIRRSMTGDDLSREVDDALDMFRGLGYRGDLHVADDLADLEDLQAVLSLLRAKSGTCRPCSGQTMLHFPLPFVTVHL